MKKLRIFFVSLAVEVSGLKKDSCVVLHLLSPLQDVGCSYLSYTKYLLLHFRQLFLIALEKQKIHLVFS